MGKNICVFCSSSRAIAEPYLQEASRLGSLLAKRGDTLIYGGANIGCMGALAESMHQHGGAIIGVIPAYLAGKGLDFAQAEELLVTETMAERKASMEDRSDAFIALPGGLGTLEELIQVITLKQLHYHTKPIVIINTRGFWDPLLEMFEHFVDEHVAKPEYRQLYQVETHPQAALDFVDNYEPTKPINW